VSIDRKKRLAKLVVLQRQLKAFHETRHSGHIAAANAAEQEARQLAERFDDPHSLSGLFPQIYHNRIAGAFTRRDASLSKAAEEARRLATASLRANMVEEAYRDVARQVDEQAADKERLENVERKLTGK
jgi:hypothetical protein